jgi:hypothetical protein
LIAKDQKEAEMKVEASPVSETTKRDASAQGRCVQPKLAPASIWTEAMLAALQRGVKGGKWHSLIDKVYRLETLKLGWAQVKKNAGAAGVDRMSVDRFAHAQDRYLAELAQALQDASYSPLPVRRVYIPKDNRRLCAPSLAGSDATTASPSRSRPQLAGSYALAECLLRWSWAVHDVCSSFIGAPIPMR